MKFFAYFSAKKWPSAAIHFKLNHLGLCAVIWACQLEYKKVSNRKCISKENYK